VSARVRSVTTRPFRPIDARRLRFVQAAGFLNDGDCFYATSEIVDDLSAETATLWVFERETRAARQIASGCSHVRWPVASPDRHRLAFVAGIDGVPQLCVASIDDGRVTVLTHLEHGVGGPVDWSPDGRFIALAAGPPERRDPATPYWVTRTIFRAEGVGLLDDVAQDIYVIDVETRELQRLTEDAAMNGRPKWSPTGEELLFLVSFEPHAERPLPPQVHAMHVTTGVRRVVVGAAWGGVVCAEWTSDGRRVVFVGAPAASGSFYAQRLDLWTAPAAGGEPECHTQPMEHGVRCGVEADLPICDLLGDPRVRVSETASSAYLSAQVGSDAAIFRVGLDAATIEPIVAGPGVHLLLDVDEEGRILHLSSTINETPDLCVTDRRQGRRRVTALNDELLRRISLPDVETLDVTAPDGLPLESRVLLPRRGSAPHPTVLYIHGGPYAAFGNMFMIDFHVLVGAGFAVLFSNFRGSTGYGSEHSRALTGQWGPAGMLDHLATVDRAVELGIADETRLGVCGYSHGGFATCWLLGHTDRFAAGVAENPLTSWSTAYAASDTGTRIPPELGGRPDEVPEVYAEHSPLTYAARCTTPLLFIVGESDLRCPPIEAEQYYRVLKATGCPTAMLRLPNSGHLGTWSGPPVARAAQDEAIVQWFNRHL
jgi:dipeptidyl aminopeptidase/acylaminoacyl peptidase